jgi:hypothetical protein
MKSLGATLIDGPTGGKTEWKTAPHYNVTCHCRPYERAQLWARKTTLDRKQSIAHGHRMKAQRRCHRPEQKRGEGIALQVSNHDADSRHAIKLCNEHTGLLVAKMVQDL